MQVESTAWLSFVLEIKHFLGNHKAPDYSELLAKMLQNFYTLKATMNIKLHFLHSHLERFPDNMGDYSEKQGELFHQDIRIMEERYQGRWDHHMMADYCWTSIRDFSERNHDRKVYCNFCFNYLMNSIYTFCFYIVLITHLHKNIFSIHTCIFI